LLGNEGVTQSEQTINYCQLKNRFLPYTGYVRSFSGIRYKNMGLQNDIAIEDSAMAFIDGYIYTKLVMNSEFRKGNFRFILSRDTRPTGKAIIRYQIKGMLKAAEEEGKSINLIDLDIATTPLWESAIREFEADGGVMITASHNPLNENGWKYADSYKNGGSLLDPKQMEELLSHANGFLQQVLNNEIDLQSMMSSISDEDSNIVCIPEQFERALAAYVKEQEKLVEGTDRSILVINDCNGGAAARVNTLALQRLGFKNVLNLNTDLGVPAHKIEPVKGKVGEENDRSKNALIDVSKAIKETGAKVGIVYDFDADRGNLVLLDKDGNVDEISPQDVAAFNVAMSLLPYRNVELDRRLVVVGHCATSGRVETIAKLLGAEFRTVEVGEVNVTKKMAALKRQGYIVPIGVEGYNGGTIFQGSQCRDGLQTLLVAMKALSNPHFFFSWLDAKGENPSNSLLYRISKGDFYLSDFISRLPSYCSIQEKRTGIRLNQKEFKKALEYAFANSITFIPQTKLYQLSNGQLYKQILVEYISEMEVQSRPFSLDFTPGFGLEGNFIEGGWRVRFIDIEDHESMIWFRGSKTESGTYRTLVDSQSETKAKELNVLLNTLFDKAAE
jgi:phosphomannomutase